MWSLRKILSIPNNMHIANAEVIHIRGCEPQLDLVRYRQRQYFGHLVWEDHHRAVTAALWRPPPEWKQHRGQPATSWLCTLEKDIKQLNSELNSAWHKAFNSVHCCGVVSMAMLFGVCQRMND